MTYNLWIVNLVSLRGKPMSTKTIAWITGTLTLLLTLFSFILSFNALTDLAAEHGVSIPPLFPLIVEAGVVIFSMNALYRSVNGESVWWQWALIIGSSLLAGSFNVAHAQADILSRVMSAMPSLFLLLSFETFIGQIKHVVKRANTVESIEQLTDELNRKRQELDELIRTKQAEVDQLNNEADRVNVSIEQAKQTLARLKEEIEQAKSVQHSSIERAKHIKAKRDAQTIEQRRTRLLNILTVEGGIGPSALADRLNTSRGTVYSDLRALSETGQVVKNGNGWEVTQ
jgi:outer membrane murein-binding lipoprotein Lpp